MNEYEITYIRRINLDREAINRVEGRVSRALERHGGEILRTLDLGEKPLAYKVDKEVKGQYFQLNLLGNGNLIDELEKVFRISSEILRFLTIRVTRNVDVEQKRKEYSEKKSNPPREESCEGELTA